MEKLRASCWGGGVLEFFVYSREAVFELRNDFIAIVNNASGYNIHWFVSSSFLSFVLSAHVGR